MKNKYFIHVDGDSFFASCEVARLPKYLNLPVVVGEERGIVTALTYEAKSIGIKRGDPIFKIKKNFPNVKILSGHFELYNKYSYNLINILKRHTNEIENYSIDECFFVLEIEEENLEKKVKEIKNEIQNKLGITYSFGVSLTKTLSKIASKRNKPDGLCILINKLDIENALKNTKIGEVWGIGRALETTLLNKQVFTAFDFINCNLIKLLNNKFNKNVFQLCQELKAKQTLKLNTTHKDQLSIQTSRAFSRKTKDINSIFYEISKNIEIACSQLRDKNLYTNKILFYIKKERQKDKFYSDLIEKNIILPNFTQSSITILKYVEQMFFKLNLGDELYKGSGVILSNLTKFENLKMDLFNENQNILNEEKILIDVMDNIRNKYGFESISLGSSIKSINNRIEEKNKRDEKDEYEYFLPFPFLGVINN